jgi:hypothetical protein
MCCLRGKAGSSWKMPPLYDAAVMSYTQNAAPCDGVKHISHSKAPGFHTRFHQVIFLIGDNGGRRSGGAGIIK